MAGEPLAFIEPKLMFGRGPLGVWGPPLGICPVAPDALMVTEGLRVCSVGPGPPLAAELLTMAGAAMFADGARTFTDSRFPCCAAELLVPLPTTIGPETEDLVAWAYERGAGA